MITLLGWLMQNLLIVAIMIPIVFVLGRWFAHRPAVQHMLWVIVLLKFITPPLIAWPWALPSSLSELLGSNEVTTTSGDEAALQGNAHEVASEPAFFTLKEFQAAHLDQASPAVDLDLPSIALGIGGGVWLLGAGVCLLGQARRIARHSSIVRQGTQAPERLKAEIHAASQRMGLRPPKTLLASGILSPFIWCLGPLRLIWPDALVGSDEIERARGIIAHELAHVRRRDHWIAWLEMFASIVWWWNPLFWLVRRQLRESAEMACDALAIDMCPENRVDYAKLLLELSSGFKTGIPAPVLGVSAGTPSSFERRLCMILSDRVSGKMSARGILAALAFALLIMPGWSLAQQQPPQDDPIKGGIVDDVKKADGFLVQIQNVQAEQQQIEATKAQIEAAKKQLELGVKRLQLLEELRKLDEKTKGVFKLERPKRADVEEEPLWASQSDLQRQIEQAQKRVEEAKYQQKVIETALRANKDGIDSKVKLFQNFQHANAGNLASHYGILYLQATKGRLGVALLPLEPLLVAHLKLPANQGLVVTEVVAASPAEKAGLQKLDILLEFAGEPVPNDLRKFQEGLMKIKVDTDVNALILRKGEKEIIKGIKLPEFTLKMPIDLQLDFKPRIMLPQSVRIQMAPTAPSEKLIRPLPPLPTPEPPGRQPSPQGPTVTPGVVNSIEGKPEVANPNFRVGALPTPMIPQPRTPGDPDVQQPNAPALRHSRQAVASGVVPPAVPTNQSTAITITNDDFVLKHSSGNLKIEIKGKRNTKGGEISIQDGTTSIQTQSIEKVPAAYRPIVERLMERIK